MFYQVLMWKKWDPIAYHFYCTLILFLNWPEDGRLRPKHVAKYNLILIIASCLDVCCVLTVHNILYKFDNTQWDGLSQKKYYKKNLHNWLIRSNVNSLFYYYSRLPVSSFVQICWVFSEINHAESQLLPSYNIRPTIAIISLSPAVFFAACYRSIACNVCSVPVHFYIYYSYPTFNA